jgi:hypothetical protein
VDEGIGVQNILSQKAEVRRQKFWEGGDEKSEVRSQKAEV